MVPARIPSEAWTAVRAAAERPLQSLTPAECHGLEQAVHVLHRRLKQVHARGGYYQGVSGSEWLQSVERRVEGSHDEVTQIGAEGEILAQSRSGTAS